MIIILVTAVLICSALGSPSIPPKLDGRIVGGNPVDGREFLYQVSLRSNGQHMCGGSIISPRHILTAAHCTNGLPASSISIRAGSSSHRFGGQVRNVERIIQHPDYDAATVDFDISILKLDQNLQTGENIQIPLLNLLTAGPGSISIVSGWGRLYENGPIPDQLQAVKVPIVSRQNCESAYGKSKITSRMICAGYLGVGGKDACQGDSGGPLVQNGLLGRELIGITSWGYGCASPNHPGVYTNVAYFGLWIRLNTGIIL